MKTNLIRWILLLPITIIVTLIVWNLLWLMIAPIIYSINKNALFTIIVSGLTTMAFSITPTKIAPHNKSRVILIFGGLALLVSIAILVLNLNGLTEFTLKKIINATFELWGTSLGFGISAWICMNEIDGD